MTGKYGALIEVLLANDVAVMPDLVFSSGNLLMWDSLDHLWGDPEFPCLHPSTAAGWQAGNLNRRPSVGRFILREQQKYDLLRTLTLEFFELFRPGYRADLVLVEKNPLADIRNTRLIRAVVAAGRFYGRSELDGLRDGRLRYDRLRQLDDQVVRALGDDDAAAALKDVVDTQREDPEALSMIEDRINAAGYAAGFAGEPERARTLLEINTQLFPDSANTWDSLAEIALHLGDRQGAIELYRRALQADPDLVNAREQLEYLQRDPRP